MCVEEGDGDKDVGRSHLTGRVSYGDTGDLIDRTLQDPEVAKRASLRGNQSIFLLKT
jgi:hypothetical protein